MGMRGSWQLPYETDVPMRLEMAYKRCQELFDNMPPSHDFIPSVNLVNSWPIITASYSGIEQSFKYLIASSCSMSVPEMRRSTRQHNHHDLRKLLVALDQEAQSYLTAYYRCYQSLHNYIHHRDLSSFMTGISSMDGRGYENWRYALVEPENDIPTNSPEGMLAVWRASIHLIMHRGGRWRGLPMPSSEIWHELRCTNPVLCKHLPDDDLLNRAAQLLWEEYRGIPEREASDEFTEALADWKSKLVKIPLLSYFIRRSCGLASGLSVRWDEESNVFEDVPWATRPLSAKNLPDGAREITGHRDSVRGYVIRSLYRRRLSINERTYDWRRAQRDIQRSRETDWQRTAEAVSTGTEHDLVVRVWEHILDPYIRVTIDGSQDEVAYMWNFLWPPPLQNEFN
ncbi:MAG: hypothetical protein OXJ90_08465 [Spirochaetaceae bacterium]|nr:hypothetical protein [Spirochaetaceae bacterium]